MNGPILGAMITIACFMVVYFLVGYLIIKGWRRFRVYRGVRNRTFDDLVPAMHCFWPLAMVFGFLIWASEKYSEPVNAFFRELDNKLNSLYDVFIHFIFGKPD